MGGAFHYRDNRHRARQSVYRPFVLLVRHLASVLTVHTIHKQPNKNTFSFYLGRMFGCLHFSPPGDMMEQPGELICHFPLSLPSIYSDTGCLLLGHPYLSQAGDWIKKQRIFCFLKICLCCHFSFPLLWRLLKSDFHKGQMLLSMLLTTVLVLFQGNLRLWSSSIFQRCTNMQSTVANLQICI